MSTDDKRQQEDRKIMWKRVADMKPIVIEAFGAHGALAQLQAIGSKSGQEAASAFKKLGNASSKLAGPAQKI